MHDHKPVGVSLKIGDGGITSISTALGNIVVTRTGDGGTSKGIAYIYPPDAEPYISNSGDLTRDKNSAQRRPCHSSQATHCVAKNLHWWAPPITHVEAEECERSASLLLRVDADSPPYASTINCHIKSVRSADRAGVRSARLESFALCEPAFRNRRSVVHLQVIYDLECRF